jgi:hypothetical protein
VVGVEFNPKPQEVKFDTADKAVYRDGHRWARDIFQTPQKNSSQCRFFACPVCVKTRNLEGAELVEGAEVKGAPSLYEFTEGGALTFNYFRCGPGSDRRPRSLRTDSRCGR